MFAFGFNTTLIYMETSPVIKNLKKKKNPGEKFNKYTFSSLGTQPHRSPLGL